MTIDGSIAGSRVVQAPYAAKPQRQMDSASRRCSREHSDYGYTINHPSIHTIPASLSIEVKPEYDENHAEQLSIAARKQKQGQKKKKKKKKEKKKASLFWPASQKKSPISFLIFLASCVGSFRSLARDSRAHVAGPINARCS
jgi:hypothetical protein